MGNSNSSRTYTQIVNEVSTSVLNEVSLDFASNFKTSVVQDCYVNSNSTISTQDIVAAGPRSNVTVNNNARVKLECLLNKATTSDVQVALTNNVLSGLQAYFSNDVLEKLNQTASTGIVPGKSVNKAFSSYFSSTKVNKDVVNKVSNSVTTNVTDETVIDMRASVSASISTGNIVAVDGGTVKVSNTSEALAKCAATVSSVNKVVNGVLNDLKAEDVIKSSNNITRKQEQEARTQGLASAGCGSCGSVILVCLGLLLVVVAIFLMGSGGGDGGDGGGDYYGDA